MARSVAESIRVKLTPQEQQIFIEEAHRVMQGLVSDLATDPGNSSVCTTSR